MTNSVFTVTRNSFAEYINYTKPLSFDEWVALPDDYKAAALYCQFYSEVTLVWYKLFRNYVPEEDALEVVIQYFMKNVDILKEHPDRFNKSYMYRVVYNCIGCLTNRESKQKSVYDNECNISELPGFDEDHDIFDTMLGSTVDDYDADENRNRFWQLIESKGRETVIVVAELLGEKVDWTTYVNPFNKIKNFSKVETRKISASRKQEIIDDLKEDLIAYLGMDQLGCYM